VLRNYERVVAPFDGIITVRNVDQGALVKADTGVANENVGGTPDSHGGLFGISRNDVLRVYVHVPQAFAATIVPGQSADILVKEYPNRVFKGTIYRTSGALDAGTRTLLTEVHIPNGDHALLPGSYAQIRFVGAGRGSGVRIPSNALSVTAAGTQVAVVGSDSKVHYRPIQISRDFGTEVEIASGLKGDERLVANPTEDLEEGAEVQVATTPPQQH
jgi:RND family efflux transporter MFP subunit